MHRLATIHRITYIQTDDHRRNSVS